jgi:PAS domain S-box-containing protein
MKKELDHDALKGILRSSEDKFRALFENSMDAILLTGPEGMIYSANPAACKMFNRSEEEIIRSGRNGIVDTTDPRLEPGLKVRESKGKFSGELTFIKKDGTRFPGELTSNVFTDSEGRRLTSMIIRDISKRRNAEYALAKSESELRIIHENITDIVWSLDKDTRLTYISPSVKRLLGYDVEYLIGKPILEFIAKEYHQSARQNIQQRLTQGKEGGQVHFQYDMVAIDGTRIPIEVSSNPVWDKDGTLLGFTGVTRNITERRKAEAIIHESEKRYHFLFDNMLNGLAYCQMVYDDSGNPVDFIYLEVNEAFGKLTGLTNVVGKRVTDVLPGIFQMDGELFNIYGRVALTGEPENCEILIKSLGHWFSVSIYCPLKNHIVAIFDVISERKNSEEKLLASEVEFRNVFENSIIGISQYYPEGNLIRINKAYAEMHGYPDSSSMLKEVGNNTQILSLNPDDMKKVLGTLDTTGYMAPTEFKLNRRNGEKFWALVGAKQVKDNAGKLLYLHTEYIDIASQKKLEQELRKSKEVLEKLNQHLVDIREFESNQIALNLHDDLGQKLTAINFDIAWLKRRIGVQSQTVKEKIEEMSQTIISTIESIKETSSLLRPAILFDLGLVPAIKAQLSHFEKQTGIKCHFLCDPERFILDNRISIILYRILQESLTNIARHSGASSAEICLNVFKNKIGMSIKDNGKGINKDQINSIKSMGIEGIKERVRSAQGKITIRGIHGSGTTIKVLIPLN